MTAQLPLALRWPPRRRFEHFRVGPNAAAVAAVRAAALDPAAPWVYLHGPSGCGRSHLLMAACQAFLDAGRHAAPAGAGGVGDAPQRVQYLPLATLPGRVAAIDGSDCGGLLALDDVDAIAGDAAAERALFHAYNRARGEGGTLLLAAGAAPEQIGIRLPDLRSRLGACTRFALKPLADADRRAVLEDQAAARGIGLDAPVLDWLFTHYARDLGALLDLLDGLDAASLAAQRHLTVPFVRDFVRTARHAP